jgi:hypothetical protein
MKTFFQFMEQIPHVGMKPIDVMRARQTAIASRQQRRHVHGELEHRAQQERDNLKSNNPL